jgi:hypothetical protein
MGCTSRMTFPIMVFLCSLLSPFDYMPFGSYDVRRYADDADVVASASWPMTMCGLFHWRHLADLPRRRVLFPTGPVAIVLGARILDTNDAGVPMPDRDAIAITDGEQSVRFLGPSMERAGPRVR